jgi:antitoxin PrlF
LTPLYEFLTLVKEFIHKGGTPMAHSTLTSKGQITIPKKVRDRLNLKTGDIIDFRMEEDAVRMIPLVKTVSDVFGMLSRKSQKPVTVEEMNRQLKKHLKDKNA